MVLIEYPARVARLVYLRRHSLNGDPVTALVGDWGEIDDHIGHVTID
jgi:hypothetical protein